MPCASQNHVGQILAIRMTGFGMFSNYDGVFGLDLDIADDKIYRRNDARILFDRSLSLWVLRDANDVLVSKQETKRLTPIGDWEDGKRVVICKESPSLVSMLAFPAPSLDLNFYQNDGVSQVPLLKQRNLIMLEVKGASKRERVPALFYRYPGAIFTVLYSHGNAEDIGLLVDELKSMSNAIKANVFAYDYVGYSTSKLEGCAPSESGCLRAITAAWQFLTIDLTIPPRNIVLYGRSIGSGPTVDLASRSYCRDTIAGVILQSPIMSGGCILLGPTAGRIGRPIDIFTNYAKIGRVRKPVAIMHGTIDDVVPLVNGQRLHALCTKPHEPFWIDGHGHNDMPPDLCDDYAHNFIKSLQAPHIPDDPDLDELFRRCKNEASSSMEEDSGGGRTTDCVIC